MKTFSINSVNSIRPNLFVLLVSAMTLISNSALAQSATDVAAEIGITPQSTVIADVNTTSATQMLAYIDGATTLLSNLAAKYQEIDAAGVTVTQLSEQLLVDSGNQTTQQQYQTAVTALATAKQELATIRSDLFTEAVQGLSAQQIQKINTCKASATYRVERAFRAKQQSHELWKATERALRAEKQALRMSETLDESHAQLLTDIRTDLAVVQTDILLQANLATMQQNFAQYGT